ncbi:hypothetical protein P691DRAFT_769152 [Macrolepiota fuliginosa MF-IS2]|uniref:Uncharacterized protein n=1 Tax=Macrolepiota fuliginosa MF-IS2 TaxID=1400762 RepID=A0A9P6BVS4_9AGAR|nr:hypothetical protein P691DRAFT_769152 [Macrolepiota fuliginosa MF-IS2]
MDRVLQLSMYALKRLKNFDYIKLWYFTPQGCDEAILLDQTCNQDALALMQVNSIMTLRLIDAVTASKNVLSDEALSWDHICLAQQVMLHHMKELAWEEEYIFVLADFFLRLHLHPKRLHKHWQEAIILYQAQIRQDWHRKLSNIHAEEVFNISAINENLLKDLVEKVSDQKKAKMMQQ